MAASTQYIQNVIATFAQAAEANARTAGREGNIIALTPQLAAEVMVTGDLHGHRRNFNLIRRIGGPSSHPGRHLVLQEACHGGPKYPHNGGCMSHAVLEDIALLKANYPDRIHFILGNHELAELTDYPIQKNRQMLNLQFRMGLERMYGDAADQVREAMLGFLRSCPLAVRLPGGVFVSHSIPEFVDSRNGFDSTVFTRELNDGDFHEQGAVFRLVWGRDYREINARAFAQQVGAQLLLNGHEPCPEGFQVPNPHQIILDCCSDRACYVILPTDQELSQAEVVGRIMRLA